jgi:serpin B
MNERSSAMTAHSPGARLAVALGAAATLTACAGASPLMHRGEAVPVQAGSLTAAAIAQAQTAFGIELLHAVCARADGGNMLLSPTSAAEALSLLYPAAGGRTAEDFRSVLHLPAWSPELVAAFAEHTRALDGLRHDGDPDDDDAPDSLQMSNRLWTATGLEPEPRYLDDLATAFDAGVQSLDFAGDPEGATDRINATVADDTRGIIEQLFDDPLKPETRAVLTNALHLNARWAVPFTGTGSAPFSAPYAEVSVDMMSGASGAHRIADGWQAVELPYRDGTLAAVAVLPPEGTDPCEVDATTLASLEAAEPDQVGVRLPRMTIEQSHGLLDVLARMGLPVTGDYSGLGEDELKIAQVVQKTFLEVDEDGTEAAAATGVAVEAVAGAAPQHTIVTFDRPFLFLLTDTETRSPLFMTVVADPSS